MDDVPTEATSRVTAADVPFLNRTVIEDACAFARQAATVLLVVGAAGVAAWAWLLWRSIDQLAGLDSGEFPDVSGGFGVFTEGEATAGDYADVLAHSASLLLVAVTVVGVSIGIRLVAAHVGNAVGVDVSEVAVGDPLPDEDEDRG